MSSVVFVSRPSVLAAPQRHMLDRWARALEASGFVVEQLDRSRYEADPWPQLTRVLDRADGLLVLGFRQLDVQSGRWRPGTGEEEQVSCSWTSPWMHVEAGMAIMAGIPVLAARERDVEEGVFAPDAWTGLLFGVTIESEGAGPALDLWASAVDARCRRRDTARPLAS